MYHIKHDNASQCILRQMPPEFRSPDRNIHSHTVDIQPSKNNLDLDDTVLWLIFRIVVVNVPGPFKQLFYESLYLGLKSAHALRWNTIPNQGAKQKLLHNKLFVAITCHKVLKYMTRALQLLDLFLLNKCKESLMII